MPLPRGGDRVRSAPAVVEGAGGRRGRRRPARPGDGGHRRAAADARVAEPGGTAESRAAVAVGEPPPDAPVAPGAGQPAHAPLALAAREAADARDVGALQDGGAGPGLTRDAERAAAVGL